MPDITIDKLHDWLVGMIADLNIDREDSVGGDPNSYAAGFENGEIHALNLVLTHIKLNGEEDDAQG